jgi:hypothetical protein
MVDLIGADVLWILLVLASAVRSDAQVIGYLWQSVNGYRQVYADGRLQAIRETNCF